MAIAQEKQDNPLKKPTSFMSKLTDFYLKYCCGSLDFLCFFVAFKFVPVPFTPLMVIQTMKNKVGGKRF
jgi:monofunctional biosynthetic peptidoglycan transglycosylase